MWMSWSKWFKRPWISRRRVQLSAWPRFESCRETGPKCFLFTRSCQIPYSRNVQIRCLSGTSVCVWMLLFKVFKKAVLAFKDMGFQKDPMVKRGGIRPFIILKHTSGTTCVTMNIWFWLCPYHSHFPGGTPRVLGVTPYVQGSGNNSRFYGWISQDVSHLTSQPQEFFPRFWGRP